MQAVAEAYTDPPVPLQSEYAKTVAYFERHVIGFADSEQAHTLRRLTQPLWGWSHSYQGPRGAQPMAGQPWAGIHSPLGAGTEIHAPNSPDRQTACPKRIKSLLRLPAVLHRAKE